MKNLVNLFGLVLVLAGLGFAQQSTLRSGQLGSLPASIITSGTFSSARIPDMTVGGDLSGTVSNATVAKLGGYPLTLSSLTSGQYIKWNGSALVNAAGTNTNAAGSTTQVQFNSSGSLAADSGFTYTTPGQIGLTPTSTSATVINVPLPASFAGDFFKFSDSSGNDNVRAFQASGGASSLRIFGRPSQTGASSIAVGYTSFPASGNNLSSYGTYALVSGTLYLGSYIIGSAAEGWSSSALGTDWLFGTCNTGSSASSQKFKISANGNIVCNPRSALATSATDGFLYIGNCAGKPTGTPTSYTGATPLIYDTTNKCFWAYDGSNWYNVATRNNQTSVSASYTALVGDDTIVVTPSNSATRTVTLPLAATVGGGKRFTIICLGNAGSGSAGVQIALSGSDTAMGFTVPYAVGSSVVYGTATVESDGVSKWLIVSKI